MDEGKVPQGWSREVQEARRREAELARDVRDGGRHFDEANMGATLPASGLYAQEAPGRPLPPQHSPAWLDAVFTYHPPYNPAVAAKYESVRRAARHFAEEILAQCPSSADRTHAIRLIREAVMTANASIALGGLV